MISIVLIEPEWASNVGAVARVMGNYDFNNLILIDPKCNIDDLDAIKRAKHAVKILKKAKIKNWEYLDKFDYLIATTSKLGSDYNIPRSPINPEQLSEKINEGNLRNKKIGVVFIFTLLFALIGIKRLVWFLAGRAKDYIIKRLQNVISLFLFQLQKNILS